MPQPFSPFTSCTVQVTDFNCLSSCLFAYYLWPCSLLLLQYCPEHKACSPVSAEGYLVVRRGKEKERKIQCLWRGNYFFWSLHRFFWTAKAFPWTLSRRTLKGKQCIASVLHQLGQAQSWAPSYFTPFDPHNNLSILSLSGYKN